MAETTHLSYGKEDGEFYIEHIKRSEPFEKVNHYHENYEIYYLLAGRRKMFIKDRSYILTHGHLAFVNKLDVHKTQISDVIEHERVVVTFNRRFLGQEYDGYAPLLFSPFQQEDRVICLKLQEQIFMQVILNKFTKEIKEQKAGFELILKHNLVELLLFSARCLDNPETKPFVHASPLHQKISEIVLHINKHYNQRITLDELSEHYYISPYYLSRSFKTITGFTFVEYMNLTRVREAQKLLKETRLKVIEIADRSGFDNIAHFGRIFKKITNLTPQQYRKQYR